MCIYQRPDFDYNLVVGIQFQCENIKHADMHYEAKLNYHLWKATL